jgi:hypothetical protein
MAGLSITRRRKAWDDGVIYGATGKTFARLEQPKLLEIFKRGIAYGREHVNSASVQAMVERHRQRRSAQMPAAPVRRRLARPLDHRQGQAPRRARGWT